MTRTVVRRWLTFESKENEESKLILLLFRIVDFTKKAKMIITSHRIIILTQNIGKGVTDISTLDNGPRFPNFPSEKEEGKLVIQN